MTALTVSWQLVKRNPTRLVISKFGRGDDETEDYNHLATLAFNSKVGRAQWYSLGVDVTRQCVTAQEGHSDLRATGSGGGHD